MKVRIAMVAAAAIWLGCAGAVGPNAPDRITVSIDAQKTAAPISKYEWGMFIVEGLGPDTIARRIA